MTTPNYRYEVKFVVPPYERRVVERWIATSPFFHRAYPPRQVHSIYVDDSALSCAFDNICGIPERRKFRRRPR